MDLGIKGKVAIVTGGARGIGRGIVEGFAKEGANIVIGDIMHDDAQELAEKLTKGGVKVLAIRTDVTKKTDVDKVVAVTLNEFDKIDILVNNAGILTHAHLVDLEEKDGTELSMSIPRVFT